jgi:hypothetical protein
MLILTATRQRHYVTGFYYLQRVLATTPVLTSMLARTLCYLTCISAMDRSRRSLLQRLGGRTRMAPYIYQSKVQKEIQQRGQQPSRSSAATIQTSATPTTPTTRTNSSVSPLLAASSKHLSTILSVPVSSPAANISSPPSHFKSLHLSPTLLRMPPTPISPLSPAKPKSLAPISPEQNVFSPSFMVKHLIRNNAKRSEILSHTSPVTFKLPTPPLQPTPRTILPPSTSSVRRRINFGESSKEESIPILKLKKMRRNFPYLLIRLDKKKDAMRHAIVEINGDYFQVKIPKDLQDPPEEKSFLQKVTSPGYKFGKLQWCDR